MPFLHHRPPLPPSPLKPAHGCCRLSPVATRKRLNRNHTVEPPVRLAKEPAGSINFILFLSQHHNEAVSMSIKPHFHPLAAPRAAALAGPAPAAPPVLAVTPEGLIFIF